MPHVLCHAHMHASCLVSLRHAKRPHPQADAVAVVQVSLEEPQVPSVHSLGSALVRVEDEAQRYMPTQAAVEEGGHPPHIRTILGHSVGYSPWIQHPHSQHTTSSFNSCSSSWRDLACPPPHPVPQHCRGLLVVLATRHSGLRNHVRWQLVNFDLRNCGPVALHILVCVTPSCTPDHSFA